MAIKEYAAKLIEQDATLKEIAEQKETLWVNPKFLPFEMTDAVCQLVVSDADIADAEARLERFAPFIRKCFPETECTNGIIESPLKPIPEMQKGLIEATGQPHLRQSVPQDGQPSGGGRLRQGPRRHL